MPIYEYQCRDCDHRLTARQRISESPLVECPECATESLQRLISQTSFVLKGTGWYASDYKKTPSAGAEAGAGEAATPSSSADSSAAGATSGTTSSSDD